MFPTDQSSSAITVSKGQNLHSLRGGLKEQLCRRVCSPPANDYVPDNFVFVELLYRYLIHNSLSCCKKQASQPF